MDLVFSGHRSFKEGSHLPGDCIRCSVAARFHSIDPAGIPLKVVPDFRDTLGRTEK